MMHIDSDKYCPMNWVLPGMSLVSIAESEVFRVDASTKKSPVSYH